MLAPGSVLETQGEPLCVMGTGEQAGHASSIPSSPRSQQVRGSQLKPGPWPELLSPLPLPSRVGGRVCPPRGVRPRLEGKPRTPLSSRVATRVSWP